MFSAELPLEVGNRRFRAKELIDECLRKIHRYVTATLRPQDLNLSPQCPASLPDRLLMVMV